MLADFFGTNPLGFSALFIGAIVLLRETQITLLIVSLAYFALGRSELSFVSCLVILLVWLLFCAGLAGKSRKERLFAFIPVVLLLSSFYWVGLATLQGSLKSFSSLQFALVTSSTLTALTFFWKKI